MRRDRESTPKRNTPGAAGISAAAAFALIAAVLSVSLASGCAKGPKKPSSGTLPPTSFLPAGTAVPSTESPAPGSAGPFETAPFLPGSASPAGTGPDHSFGIATPGNDTFAPETPSGAASASQHDPTAHPTSETGQPTSQVSVTPGPDEDVLISGFNEIPIFLDWHEYGLDLANPVMSAGESEFSEEGSSLKVILSDNTAWQYFIEGVTLWSPSRKYVRLWLVNATGGSLDVGLALKDSSGAATFDASKAVVRLCDGSAVSVESRDSSGMGNGIATSLVIPHGFTGWLSFPADSLITHWSDPPLEGDPSTVSIDVRPSGYVSGGAYYIDGLCLTDSTAGTLRASAGFTENSVSANKKYIEASVAAALSGTVDYDFAGSIKAGDHTISGIIIEGSGDGVRTRFSALLGIPSSAGADLPAVILLGDPGSDPSLNWVRNWMDAGYAVIMPDLSGGMPFFSGGSGRPETVSWKRELPEAYALEGSVLMPSFDMMSNSKLSADMQWMFHALEAAARCSAILRSGNIAVSPGTGISGIGAAGIGWGGVVATLYAGYDKDLAFAIPMQAAAFLDRSSTPVKEAFSGSETKALWSASSRLSGITAPMLFIGGGSQGYFDISCLSDSYFAVSGLNGGTCFAILDGFEADAALFENAPIQYLFANKTTGGASAFPSFVTMPSKGSSVDCEVSGAVTAELFYLTGNYTYGFASPESGGYPLMKSTWKKSALSLSDGRVTGSVPAGAVIYYVRIADAYGNSAASVIFD